MDLLALSVLTNWKRPEVGGSVAQHGRKGLVVGSGGFWIMRFEKENGTWKSLRCTK